MDSGPQNQPPAGEWETTRLARNASQHANVRVMLLSDLPFVAWGLEQLIASAAAGMSYAGTASSVEAGLGLMKSNPIDIVLLDLDGDIGPHGIAEMLNGGRTRVLVLTTSRDAAFCDAAVLAGASGVVNKRDTTTALLKAIRKVHEGEFWLDRAATGRVFVAMARQRADRDPELAKIARLTRKERLTVSELARDPAATSRDISARLCISEHTLRNHLTSIYAKLDVRNRTELYAYATRHHLATTGVVRLPAQGGGAEAPRKPTAPKTRR